MRTDLRDDPAIIAIANKTRLDIHGVVGRLHRFWSWADCHSQDGEFPGMDPSYIDKITSKSGFAQAMLDVNWLELSPSGFRVPRFGRHNGASAKKRVSNAASQKLSRERHRDGIGTGDETVTREEKRREEKKREEKNREPNPAAPAIAWSAEGGWQGIVDADRTEWAAAFPACNLDRQLAAMVAWLRSNPTKARKSNWRKFITNWLNRSQDKGGDAASTKSNGQYRQPPQQIPTNVGPTRAW